MLELFVVGATLAAVVGLRVSRAHQRAVAGRTLEEYARVRGHAFAPASSASGRASPRVDGTRGDAPFTIDFCRIGARLSTRVSALVLRAPAPRLAVVQRSRLARAIGLKEDGLLELGEGGLAAAYRFFGVSAEEARALMEGQRAPLAALDERAHVWMACDGALASVTWDGVETEVTVLDAARDLVLAVAALHRPEAPYR